MKRKDLLDSSMWIGSDLKELKSIIRENQKIQRFIEIDSKEINLLSLLEVKDGKFFFTSTTPEINPLARLDDSVNSFKIGFVKGTFSPESLAQELKDKTKTLVEINDETMFVSSAIAEGMQRFGVAGEFLTDPDKETGFLDRNLIIQKRFKKGYPCTLCVKTIGGVSKIFSIRSGKYTPIDQEIIFKIIKRLSKKMGEPECKKWEFSHFFTSVYVEFPDHAEEIHGHSSVRKYIPGLVIMTSDTGNSSLIIRGTWRNADMDPDETAHFGEVSVKHMGAIDIDEICKEVENTIFVEYKKIAEAMCELLMRDISEGLDLSTPAGKKINRERVEKILRKAFKDIDLVKILGKKSEIKIREQIMSELDFRMPYTAYDIADIILAIPGRAKGPRQILSRLAKECGKAPFLDYETDTVTLSEV